MQSDLNKHTEGLIYRKQTTFLIIHTNLGHHYKIDYIGKKEFFLKGKSFIGFEILTDHPLLLDYQSELNETIYISSKYENADSLIKEIRDLVTTSTNGYKLDTIFWYRVWIAKVVKRRKWFLFLWTKLFRRKGEDAS